MASWAEWNAALAQAKLGITPAELHGSVTGYLCAGWGGPAHELLTALTLESGEGADDALHRLVDAAAKDIHAKLVRGVAVDPLLPDGNLVERANAMVDWCRGFLGGLGLTGVLQQRGRDPDVDSVLADFGRIASMHLEADDDDDASLDEVLDFIRSGVSHLHGVFAPTARP